MPYEIGIIGAGIGGACLAQILKKNGIRVAVYEGHRRSEHMARGFWIEINRDGIASLRACLTSGHFEKMMASSRPTIDPDGRWLPRALLLQYLLQGLDETVRFDKTFVRYEEAFDGRIAAYFADHTSTNVDVLVAADGVHSKVRQQFLPHARRVETGVFAIGGTAELTTEILEVLPPNALDYPIAVNGPNSQQMFIAVWRSLDKSSESGGNGSDETADHVMWRFSTLSSAYGMGQAPETASKERLKTAVLAMITSWRPNLRRLVELIDPATIFPLSIRTCLPLEHWNTAPITVLGDAIHGMAPYGGFGANTAMRDASLLGQLLSAASHGKKSLLDAVCDYEAEMLEYGFDAARRSMQILRQVNGLDPLPLS